MKSDRPWNLSYFVYPPAIWLYICCCVKYAEVIAPLRSQKVSYALSSIISGRGKFLAELLVVCLTGKVISIPQEKIAQSPIPFAALLMLHVSPLSLFLSQLLVSKSPQNSRLSWAPPSLVNTEEISYHDLWHRSRCTWQESATGKRKRKGAFSQWWYTKSSDVSQKHQGWPNDCSPFALH